MLVDELPPEKQITGPNTWAELSLEELFRQKSIMYDRWEYLNSIKHPNKDVFVDGLNKLEEVIQMKLLQGFNK